jgi:hypothetical protein
VQAVGGEDVVDRVGESAAAMLDEAENPAFPAAIAIPLAR